MESIIFAQNCKGKYLFQKLLLLFVLLIISNFEIVKTIHVFSYICVARKNVILVEKNKNKQKFDVNKKNLNIFRDLTTKYF